MNKVDQQEEKVVKKEGKRYFLKSEKTKNYIEQKKKRCSVKDDIKPIGFDFSKK